MKLNFKAAYKALTKKGSTRTVSTSSGIFVVPSNTFGFLLNEDAHFYEAYVKIPQIRAVIDHSAAAFVRNIITQEKKTSTGIDIITDGNLFDVLHNPHPLQSEKEFWESFYKNWKIFGRVHVFKNIPSGFKAENIKGMIVLPSKDVQIIPKKNANYLTATNINEIVERYELNLGNGRIQPFQPEDIWTLTDSSLNWHGDQYLYPEPAMKSLQKPITIISAIYGINEELNSNHGAIGIISPKGKDATGDTITLTSDQKTDLQEDYANNYGLMKGDYKLIITNNSVGFDPISLPIKDLLLSENLQDQLNAITNAHQFPPYIFANKEGTTFSNSAESQKALYNQKIIPETEIVSRSINMEFGTTPETGLIVFNNDHIEALQADKKDEAEKNKINSQSILDINKSVKAGEITHDIGVNILVGEYKIPPTEAEELIIADPVIVNEPILVGNEN